MSEHAERKKERRGKPARAIVLLVQRSEVSPFIYKTILYPLKHVLIHRAQNTRLLRAQDLCSISA
jgi:hypothetical protein